jgi:ABC-2 type transport system permease protein
MATVMKTASMEARQLQSVTAGGWRGGLGNLLRKEFGQWWHTNLWWIQLIIWLALLTGIATIIMVEATQAASQPATDQPVTEQADAVQTFLLMGAAVIGIGVITTLQGAIVGEKQSGTAAWVMSKPASRQAFILSKAAAHSFGFGVTAIILPAAIFIAETQWLFHQPVTLGPFLVGLSLIALNMLFFLALTLMLGTVFDGRGPIAGIGIAVVLGGMFFKGMFPPVVVNLTPWLVGDIGAAIALDMPLPDNWIVPVVATVFWTIFFMVVALWRFSREDF